MNKLIKFLLLLIMLINSSINPFNITKLFDSEDISRQATLNIELHKQAKKLAKQKVADKEELNRRVKFLTSIMKLTGYLTYNSLKFGYKLLTNTSKTIERLKKGNSNVVSGCIGFIITSLLAIIYYNKYKAQQFKNAKNNEEARKRMEAEIEALRKQQKENMEKANSNLIQQSLHSTTQYDKQPAYNPYYYDDNGILKQNLYPKLDIYNS